MPTSLFHWCLANFSDTLSLFIRLFLSRRLVQFTWSDCQRFVKSKVPFKVVIIVFVRGGCWALEPAPSLFNKECRSPTANKTKNVARKRLLNNGSEEASQTPPANVRQLHAAGKDESSIWPALHDYTTVRDLTTRNKEKGKRPPWR